MPLTALKFQAGVFKDDTALAAEGGWTDADKIRFRRGLPQTIGGWDAAITTPFTGIARGGHAWSDNSGRRWLAWGTATSLYVFAAGSLTDITPEHSRGVLVNALSTTSGSPSVSVKHTDHGLATGNTITFSNQGNPVAGLTLSGSYTVTATDKDTYTVTAGSNASASLTNVGGNLDYVVPLPAGLTDSLGEPGGYGSGAYDAGGYGGTVVSAATLARTWSLDNWGQNLVAVPRGGALYEFQPSSSYAELVTSGDFAASTKWTLGTGWTIGAGVATATTGALSNIRQDVAIEGGKVYRVSLDVTFGAAGTTNITVGGSYATTNGSNIISLTWNAHGLKVGDVFTIAGATSVGGLAPNGTWVVDSVPDANTISWQHTGTATSTSTGGGVASNVSAPKLTLKTDVGDLTPLSASINKAGSYVRYFRAQAGAKQLRIEKNTHFAGTIDNVSVKLAAAAYRVVEAPVANESMFVDPNRIVVLVGTNLFGDVYNPMAVRWSDREDITAWTPLPINLAGDFLFAVGGKAIAGIATRSQNLIWTDTALYTMNFTGSAAEPFSFRLVGTGCGLGAPLAKAEHNGAAYWISQDGFFRFAGGAPEPIPSTLRRDFFEHISSGQIDKISAGVNSGFSEVWWLYPDSRDGVECSRYVAYSFEENHWICGTFNRSTFVRGGVFPFPVMIGTDGLIYYHESGQSAGGGAFTWFLQAADQDLDDGDSLMRLGRIVPDFEDQVGAVIIDVSIKRWPNDDVVLHSTHVASPNTRKLDFRASARILRLKLYGSSAPMFMRLGAMRVDMEKTGMTR